MIDDYVVAYCYYFILKQRKTTFLKALLYQKEKNEEKKITRNCIFDLIETIFSNLILLFIKLKDYNTVRYSCIREIRYNEQI